MRRLVTALVVALLLLAGCGGSPKEAATPKATHSAKPQLTRLQKARKPCVKDDHPKTMSLEDRGHTLAFDTYNQDTGANSIVGVACVLAHLHTPTRIVDNMDSTNALMGRQSAEANGLSYEWSYHPDNGLDLVIYDK